MMCPRCGERGYVDHTSSAGGKTVRYYVCRKCYDRWKTIEQQETGRMDAKVTDEARVKQYSAQSFAVDMVINERARQLEKWGPQDTNSWPEWVSILMEEVGELAEAINETWFCNATHPERGGLENIRREAIQVAAVAVSIIEATLRLEADACGDRKQG